MKHSGNKYTYSMQSTVLFHASTWSVFPCIIVKGNIPCLTSSLRPSKKFNPWPIQCGKYPCSWAVFCCRCMCLVLTCSYCDEQWQASSWRNAPGLSLKPPGPTASLCSCSCDLECPYFWAYSPPRMFFNVFLFAFPILVAVVCSWCMHWETDKPVHLDNESELELCAMSVWSHGNMSSWMLPIYTGILTKHCFEDYLLWIWWLLNDYQY